MTSREGECQSRERESGMQGVRTVLDNRRGPLGGGLQWKDGAATHDLRIGVLQVGVVDLTAGSGRVSARRARGAHGVRDGAVECIR